MLDSKNNTSKISNFWTFYIYHIIRSHRWNYAGFNNWLPIKYKFKVLKKHCDHSKVYPGIFEFS